MPRDFDRNDLSSLRDGRHGAGPADQGASAADELSAYEARDVYASRDTRNASTARPQGLEPPQELPQYGGMPAQDPSAGAGAWDGVRGDGVPGGAPLAPEKRSSKVGWTVLKVIGVLAAGYVGMSMVLGVLSVGLLAVGLSSCMASCSDNPIGDSRENAAFIADLSANSRDLAVFDALRGSIESLCETHARRDDDPGMTVDELRAAVAAGRWPKDDVSEALSARVWVRIAELSQDWLAEQTGEQWEVVDFAYPFPDNGPVPVPAVRDESSRCFCRLLCTQGDDRGLYVSVSYYRWAEEAYFEHTLDEERAEALERAQLADQVDSTGLLGARPWLMSGDDLVIWELGENDELRDPATFVETANELTALMGIYRHVTLVKADTPVVVGYDWLSSDYPNNKPLETVPFDEARERLLMAGLALYQDHAAGDILLDGYRSNDEEVTLASLSGTLSGNDDMSWQHPWHAPDEESVFDSGLVTIAARELGVPEEQVIVASAMSGPEDSYNTMTTWLIVPSGTLPETPQAFCRQADALRDLFWDQIPPDDERNTSLYLHIFEMDEMTLRDADGTPTSFAQLREVAQGRPADLDGYTFDVLLSVMPSATLWSGDQEVHAYDTEPSDVAGSIARSRDWHYSDE